MTLARQRLLATVVQFLRSAGVGALATVVDLLVLTVLVEVLRVPPTVANVPALVAGGLVQFVGNRQLVFGAGGGSLARHLGGFVLTELGSLTLNAISFHVLVTATPIPYALARVLGQALVYVGFSYPMWTRVFRAPVTAREDRISVP